MGRPAGSLITVGIVLTLLVGCTSPQRQNPSTRIRDDLLGTVISLTVYDELGNSILDDMTSAIERVDRLMSIHNPNSELSLASTGTGNSILLSPETQKTVAIAIDACAYSDGAFNPAIGSLTRLWGIGTEAASLPSRDEIIRALAFTDPAGIQLESGQLILQPGMLVDLGGIAKGYACDLAVQVLEADNADGALLDLGGNIYAYGEKPDGTPWKIGVRSPLIGESGIIGMFELRESISVVTSGGYERYFEQDGVIYHHILNPATGYPADSGLLSVTVLCDNSAWADALSTACFVLGLEKGQALIARIQENKPEIGLRGALFISDDLRIHGSEPLPFHLEDNRFQVVS